MNIFSMKPGHDGSIALIDAKRAELLFSWEAEKDNFPRYEVFNPDLFMAAARELTQMPDVFAVSGWAKGGIAANGNIGAGYYGCDESNIVNVKNTIFGLRSQYFSSSHLRSHIMSVYGMSPFPQGQPCYVLVWEGAMGDFYLVDESVRVTHLGNVMITPGNKYGFLYALADPNFRLPKGKQRLGDAGKLMALCAYGEPGEMNIEEKETAEFLLHRDSILTTLDKEDMKWSPYYNIGLEMPKFVTLARRFSDEIFRRFLTFAQKNLTAGYPLLISGGCGLNCDWNTLWKRSELFQDVFVSPCCNDTGSAIGTAIDAMFHFSGNAKLKWNVYSGQAYVDDAPYMPDVDVSSLNIDKVAKFLFDGKILGWARGRCEIGPRALGNRSILASPFFADMKKRLNKIKQRENFRPIAPMCIEDDVSEHFAWNGPSPYMLFFQHVTNPGLQAITHVDGTARVQTVNSQQNAIIYQLLTSFKSLSSCGVLCNTSLNFNGTGFINRTSDLYLYAKKNGLDGFVYEDNLCMFR